MNFLRLPTDNLYKFIAIGGLFLIGVDLVCPYFLVLHHTDMKLKANELLLQNSFRKLEFKNDETALKLIDAHEKWLLEYAEGSFEIGKIMAGRSHWIGYVGGFMAGGGFVVWYVCVQRYQDRIIRNEAAKA